MAKMKAGYIGFMSREAMQAPDNTLLFEELKTYAGLGYKGFEVGECLFRHGDPAENLKKVKSFGIKPLGIACNVTPTEKPDVAELVKKCRAIDVNNVLTYVSHVGRYRFGGIPEMATYDETMKEIENLDAVAKDLASEGINFGFHNHDAEFNKCYNGVPTFYLMAANSQYLKFEVDVGWVTYSGNCPVRVLNQLEGRLMPLVHIKDFVPGVVKRPDGVTMPRFTTPGTGVLKLKECLEAASKLGVEYAVVEQDFQYNLTQKETLTAAYLNMKETNLVK